MIKKNQTISKPKTRHQRKKTLRHDEKWYDRSENRRCLSEIGSDCLTDIFKFFVKSAMDLLVLSHISSEWRLLINSNPLLWNCKITSKYENRCLSFYGLNVQKSQMLKQFLLEKSAENNETSMMNITPKLIEQFSKKNGGHYNRMICHTDELVNYWEYEIKVRKDLRRRDAIYSKLGYFFEWIQRCLIVMFCIYCSFQDHVMVMKTGLDHPIYSWTIYSDYAFYIAFFLEPLLIAIDFFIFSYYRELVPNVRKAFHCLFSKKFMDSKTRYIPVTMVSFAACFSFIFRLIMYFTYDASYIYKRRLYFAEMDQEQASLYERTQLIMFNGEEQFRNILKTGNLIMTIPLAALYWIPLKLSQVSNTIFSFGIVLCIQCFSLVLLCSWKPPLIAFVICLGVCQWMKEKWFGTLLIPFVVSLTLAHFGLEPVFVFTPYAVYYLTCGHTGNWNSNIEEAFNNR
ncbi:hypothetical protein C9374_008344 [Naegleria lovaniensis]|uniref:F-box domain-containing protein n=1 Tax=Naegleria lovaniensis TaxID=51637 RepID=A0AA88GKM1_NAELO|nr:uncharacterized protein C9374_008344 [Naegleria lovaniensis]KAG2378201.1 hypothetical protein C9374_008344 [Naegleria lovaniensis]